MRGQLRPRFVDLGRDYVENCVDCPLYHFPQRVRRQCLPRMAPRVRPPRAPDTKRDRRPPDDPDGVGLSRGTVGL